MLNTDRDLIKSLQEGEQEFKYIYSILNGASDADVDRMTKQEQRSLSSHTFVVGEDELLYCIDQQTLKSKIQSRTHLRLCAPKQLRKQIMIAIHSGPFCSHPGVVRMMDKLKMYVWWPGMHSDIIKYVATCDVCQRAKRTPTMVAPQSISLPTRPWQQIGIDVVGPLPTTKKGNVYIVDVACHFIRYVEGWAVLRLT